jgi:hypothetical protein
LIDWPDFKSGLSLFAISRTVFTSWQVRPTSRFLDQNSEGVERTWGSCGDFAVRNCQSAIESGGSGYGHAVRSTA